MAAYAALVSLMNDLELILNHPRHSFSFDNKQITSLSQTVGFLIDFMESYDSDGCSREAAEALERRIASAAHAAHDVIESHVVDQIQAGSTLRGKARYYFLIDLQKVIDNMDYVRRKAFKAKSGLKAKQPTHSPPTSAKDILVGFDAVVVQLMEMLTGEPSSQVVIPIVGMGGMGKTTLAQYAYDHLYIKQYFDVCHWATISQEYSVENILTELLFGKTKSIDGIVNELGEQLHKKLWGRRYLIILDDMWSMDAWNKIQMFLPDNGNGSRVIVTTRLSDLASHLSSSPLDMKFLEEDKSWELFCGRSFGEENCPLELKEIGKRIVKRCQGLPLSIVVIGGHLRKSSRAIEYWEKVANLINPILSSGEDEQCFNILNLSYHHLPVCLKPCFVYMGIFPEDRRFHPSNLVQLWVAEGFVKPKKGLSLEEVAEDYLQDLIDRNLILVDRKRWNGKPEICVIHDIVRELCLKVAKKEKFMCVFDDNTQAIHSERRIAIPKGKHDSDFVGALESASLLRSLISHGEPLSFDQLSFDLRLLRLSRHEYGGCFPVANFQQVNLRYLASYSNIRNDVSPYILSWSISLFWNLQTLVIIGDYRQIIAPSEIWEMPQLRLLDFWGLCLPDPLPAERSNQQECIVLQNLHTLSGVRNFKLSEEVCKRIPNIKELSLSYFPLPCHWEAGTDYCPYNLGRFHKLESLRCYSRGDPKVQSFTFPISLQELSLSGSHLHWEDLAVIVKSLPHLGVLELESVQGLEWNLDDEEFPRLKILKIYECVDLISWNANSSHFPVLEILEVWFVPELSEIPFDIGEIPTLRLIKLGFCSVSAAISAMRIVAEQESLENHDLRLEIDFQEMEEVERFQKMVQEKDLRSNNLRLSCQNKKIKVF